MKYETEIDKILNELGYEDGMLNITTQELKQMLSDDIEVGVKNGYTVKKQIELLKLTLDLT